MVGGHAVRTAAEHGSGFIATILGVPGPGSRVRYDRVPLRTVANSERSFPDAWIAPSRIDVTDAFVAYALPLIEDSWPRVASVGGPQRFARLPPVLAEKKLPDCIPQAHRT